MERRFNQKIIYQILSFLVPFIVYLITLAPDVMFIDAGELATSASKLGIAHPTGYPLFTLLGNLFSKLLPGNEIYILNLMCAVVSSAGLVIFFNLMVLIFTELNLYEAKKSGAGLSLPIVYNISFAAVLMLAFSRTFWDSANSLEVYSLHSFFLIFVIYLFLKALNFNSKKSYWIIFAYVLGLGFANHMSMIFLSVGFLYLYFTVNGFNKQSLKFVLILALPFLLGYSVYIYLLARSGNLVVNWGNPDSIGNLLDHMLGKQFANLMFGSSGVAGAQLTYFIDNFPLEFFYVPLLLVIPGIMEMYRQSKRLFAFTLILFFFNLVYAINYNVYDIDSYFLLAFIVTSVWIGYGFKFLINKFQDNKAAISYVAVLVCLIPLWQNFSNNDKSKDLTVRDYVSNIFKTAPENSLILTTQWNYLVSPSWYYQMVKNERPDLIIINKEQLSERWYIDHVKKHYPDIYERSKPEFDLYLIELTKFENHNSKYSNPRIDADNQDILKFQNTFKNLMNSIVDKNYNNKKIYVTYEIEEDKAGQFAKDYSRVPEGLLFRYTKDKNFTDYTSPEFTITLIPKNDYYHEYIKKSYMQSFLGRAGYLMQNLKLDEASKEIDEAIKINPDSPEANTFLNKLNQLKAKE